MRTGLITLGIIFLIAGAIFYFMPLQSAAATTTNSQNGDTSVRTSSASFYIPWPVTLAMLLIGAALLTLGFALPGPVVVKRVSPDDETYDVSSTEEVDLDNGHKRTIVRENHVHRAQRR